MRNRAILADSAETAFCAVTSAAALLGTRAERSARVVVG
jgi:hypothetical protein